MKLSIIKEKEQFDIILLNNEDYQPLTYNINDNSVYIAYDEDIPFLKFIENLKNELKAEYFKKEKQLERIEKFISFLTSKYNNIINMITVNDPEKELSKIFVLKIPENVSPEERLNIQSEIIDECIRYCENNDLMDTFMDTAIFARR